nr:PREDICTED: GPI mannosyltransferase 2 [Bemisia tabaci]XP_018902495.1 PREDICTED: GPI mannosyltransferase 2 [Bemisia tabaci]
MKQIAVIAFASRFLVLVIQFVTNCLIPDHQSEDAFQGIGNAATPSTADVLIQKFFGGLRRWDAQHFLHIAKYGYTYENNLAFFPAFPIAVREFNRFFLFPLHFFISESSALLLTAVILNVIFFILSAIALYKLTSVVLMNQILAYYSTLLFCINPASIFFTAPYSESFYTFCTFSGLLLLELNVSPLLASILFAEGSIVRSNGIVNLGFVAYKILLRFREPRSASIFRETLQIVLSAVMILSPFCLYQVYAYLKFCTAFDTSPPIEIQLLAIKEKYVMPGADLPWCQFSVPVSYFHIQKKYWNVGFMEYFELKQIPNFVLASPILLLIFYNSLKFFFNHKNALMSVGSFLKLSPYSLRLFPYVVHILYLSVFCFFCAHVQIATRMLASASPILYWYASSILVNNSKVLRRKIGKIDSNNSFEYVWNSLLLTELQPLNSKPIYVKYYFLLYCVIGTSLFSNNLPWT